MQIDAPQQETFQMSLAQLLMQEPSCTCANPVESTTSFYQKLQKQRGFNYQETMQKYIHNSQIVSILLPRTH